MLLFSLGALALSGVVICLLLPALLNRRPVNRDDSHRQNIRIARRRLGELNRPDDAAVDDDAHAEIQAALLDDLHDGPAPPPAKIPGKAWAVLISVLIPVAAAGFYLALGTPAALRVPEFAVQSEASGKLPPVTEMIAQLEAKLAEDPANAQGWALAGAAYMGLGRHREAERAYHNLHQLVGDDPEVLTAWADAALMANNGAFSPHIRARIERALALRPEHDNALWLAALEAEDRADYRQASEYLRQLRPLLEADGRDVAEVERFMARIQRTRGGVEETDSAGNAGNAVPDSVE